MTWDTQTLHLLARQREVDIEVNRLDGSRLAVTIWVVVEGDEVFIRSWKGERGRWYRAAVARPEAVVLIVGERRIPVSAVPAIDADSISRCSRALESKYAGDPSTPGMVRDEVLGTTLRLEPR